MSAGSNVCPLDPPPDILPRIRSGASSGPPPQGGGPEAQNPSATSSPRRSCHISTAHSPLPSLNPLSPCGRGLGRGGGRKHSWERGRLARIRGAPTREVGAGCVSTSSTHLGVFLTHGCRCGEISASSLFPSSSPGFGLTVVEGAFRSDFRSHTHDEKNDIPTGRIPHRGTTENRPPVEFPEPTRYTDPQSIPSSLPFDRLRDQGED